MRSIHLRKNQGAAQAHTETTATKHSKKAIDPLSLETNPVTGKELCRWCHHRPGEESSQRSKEDSTPLQEEGPNLTSIRQLRGHQQQPHHQRRGEEQKLQIAGDLCQARQDSSRWRRLQRRTLFADEVNRHLRQKKHHRRQPVG